MRRALDLHVLAGGAQDHLTFTLGVPLPSSPRYHAPTVSARDPKELAERAGVPVSYVDQLIELGIVTAGEDGTFSDADVYRVRFVWSSDRGGLSIEAIARAIHEGRFSLAFLEGTQFRWASLSPRTYAEVADEVGVPLEFVLAFEEALGKVRPVPDDAAPSDLEELLEAPRVAMDAGVIDDRTPLRLIGVYAVDDPQPIAVEAVDDAVLRCPHERAPFQRIRIKLVYKLSGLAESEPGGRYAGARGSSVHGKHDLATLVAGHAALECPARLLEREDLVEGHAQAPGIRKPANRDQLVAVGLDDEVEGGDAARSQPITRGFLGDRHQPSRAVEHRLGSGQPIPAHGVEDEVHVVDRLLEVRGGVIDHLVRSELTGPLDVVPRCGGDYVRAALASELGRELADPTRGSVNEDALARCQLAVIEEPLPGTERREGDRGRLRMRERSRLRRQEFAGDGRVVRGDAIAIEPGEGVNRIPDRGLTHVSSHRGDHAR